jgi:S1-C subfamily serine protease
LNRKMITAALLALIGTSPVIAKTTITEDNLVQLFMKVPTIMGPQSSSCSGTEIGAGTILTAGHCVPDANTLIAVRKEHGVSRLFKAYALAPEMDLAVIVEVGKKVADITKLDIGSDVVRDGDVVISLGYGEGLPDRDELSARVVGLTPHPLFDGLAVATDADTVGGMSGGPVIDTAGKLVGVVSAGMSGPHDHTVRSIRSLFVPLIMIKDFLRDMKPLDKVVKEDKNKKRTAAHEANK